MTLKSINNFENLDKKSRLHSCNKICHENYSNILEIPQEVFIKVLYHLRDKKDIVQIFNALSISKTARKTQSFTTICRYLFTNIVVDTIRVENIHSIWSPTNDFSRYVPVNICEESINQFQSVRNHNVNVFFDVCEEVDFTWESHSIYPSNSLFIKYYDIRYLMPFMKYIQSITIHGKYNKFLNIEEIRSFVDACPNLVHFGSEISKYTYLRKGVRSFAYVSIDNCLLFTDSFFKNLNSIHITFNNQEFDFKSKSLLPIQIDLDCFPELEKLYIIANNDIKLLSRSSKTFPKIKKLFLYSRKKNGSIEKINSQLFPNLVSLFLFAERSPFSNTSNKNTLEFKKLKNLYYRCMEDLPKNFVMPHISNFQLVSSPLDQLPSNLDFKEVKSLKINNFSVYSRVEVLNHPWDLISDMSNLLSKLHNFKLLTHLNLSNSLISEFTVDVKHLPNLTLLDLSLNPIHTFRNINESNVLQTLNLNRTNIQTIDYELKLPKLAKLTLRGTELSALKNVGKLRQLKYLDFSVTTAIENIDQIVDLQNLETLILVGCKIKNLSPIFELSELLELDLAKATINSLQNISRLQRLKTLRLSRIDDLMPIFSIKSLTNLSLNIWASHEQKYMSKLIHLKTLTIFNQSLYNFSAASKLTFMKSDKKLIATFLKSFAPASLEIINLPYGEHGINVVGWSCFKNMMVKDSPKYGKFQRCNDASSIESMISNVEIPLLEIIEI